jgi:glycerol kinase
MTAELILAIDQGTTSSRAIIFDVGGRQISLAQQDIPLQYPEPGWVNQNPADLRDITLAVCHDALNQAGREWSDLAAIGITNQRETTVLWDRATGEPVTEAIVWQSRQTSDVIRQWDEAGLSDLTHRTTGLVLDPYFSASKIRWLLDRNPDLRSRAEHGEIAFGTVDSWLIWNLTGGEHLIDLTNASRTLLFDIHAGCWSEELSDAFGVPPQLLPHVVPSAGNLAKTGPEFGSVPIAGIAGDQHASLFGHGCFAPGMAKCTYGTGAFTVMNTGAEAADSQSGLLTSPAWNIQGKTTFGLEGAVLVSGSAIQWLRDGLGLISSSHEIEALAASVPDSGGVVFVPALTGLGAPEWDADARGTIVGITRGTTREHIARAALDGMAAQVAALTDLMQRDSGQTLAELRVDGGASRNDLLMQLQADLTGVPVARSAQLETTAFGAAMLAAIGVGLHRSLDQVAVARTADRIFTPRITEDMRVQRMRIWNEAVTRSRGWAGVLPDR